jgi:hypothetical protein
MSCSGTLTKSALVGAALKQLGFQVTILKDAG